MYGRDDPRLSSSTANPASPGYRGLCPRLLCRRAPAKLVLQVNVPALERSSCCLPRSPNTITVVGTADTQHIGLCFWTRTDFLTPRDTQSGTTSRTSALRRRGAGPAAGDAHSPHGCGEWAETKSPFRKRLDSATDLHERHIENHQFHFC